VSVPLTIKIGGIAGAHAASIAVVARDAPRDTVVVHGGGSEVGRWSERLGIEPRSHEGLRVTDAETLEVVVAVLGGLVNIRLVAAFLAAGRPAIGLTGVDANLLRVERRDATLGEVGRVVGMDPRAIGAVHSSGHLPVVAPIGRDDEGAILNVNADEAAGLVAAGRGGRLLLCTDVPGVLHEGRVVGRLDTAGVRRMLDDGTASAGMRPKLRAALVAARNGCNVRIIDGRDAAAVAEAIAGGPVGTEVTAE
jgi:acetylglutamate kinase